MGEIVRCITDDGRIVIIAQDSTDIVKRAEEIHKTSAVVTAALGRLLTACSLMGAALKGDDDTITLQMHGDGPAGMLLTVSDSCGNVRGSVTNPVVEIPLNKQGKLDVGGAVGRNGTFYVIKDYGLKEPYIGQIPITSGEIAEDVTSYYAVSEQIPTVCALGVLVDTDLTPKAAGGYIIQLLPTATDEDIEFVEGAIKNIENVSNMIESGMTPEDICRRVLKGRKLSVLEKCNAEYRCNCSRERIERALISTGTDTLRELAAEDKRQEICCQFCDKKYCFDKKDILSLISKALK